MAYQALSATTPVTEVDRIANIETDLIARETASLLGTHYYAGGYIPATATSGTDTAGISGTMFVCEVRIAQNTLLTGINILVGSANTTTNVLVALFDVNGGALAHSALAGVALGTTATVQAVPFTATYPCKPGLYYIGVILDATGGKIRTQAFGAHNSNSVTGQTFGTVVAITPPSTFVASLGPVAMTY